MKPTVQHKLSLTCLALLAVAAGSALRAAEFRDRISPEELRQRQQGGGLPKNLPAPAEPDARVKSSAEQSLITQSQVLSDGTYWTLVPTGSILHAPDRLQARLPEQPSGELLQWTQFLRRNRSWISTEEVDFETAAGQKPIAEKTIESWARRSAVVVAVHRGGAISVAKPKPETPASEAAAAETAANTTSPEAP